MVAPSGAFDATLVWRALGYLSTRYRLVYRRDLFSRQGYLAGSDDRRAAELDAALRDPSVRAILAARGGYGANRIMHRVDFRPLCADPKWIVGFSDITALHLEATRAGVRSLHASNMTAIGRSDDRARRALVAALEGAEPSSAWTVETLCAGSATGPLVGGNLALVHACATAGTLRLPEGSILLLEDIGERPYRIDRMLTTLVAGGHLTGIRGVVGGEFVGCGAGPDRVSVNDVLRDAFEPLGIPVAVGAPVGHGLVNEPVELGCRVRLEAQERAQVEFFGAV